MHSGIKLVAAVAIVVVACAGNAVTAVSAEQAVKSKSACQRAGGKARANPYKSSKREYPYICTYPDRLDRECARKNGYGWFYDVDSRKCEPEDDCLIFGDC
jgi:hypothetical protein